MKVCSNTKLHRILNNRIIFDGNKCGLNQCYECITNIFHNSLAREEGQMIKDKLVLDCGCEFQRSIILNFLNQQCFNSIDDAPYYSQLKTNKVNMRHPVKKYVSKRCTMKKWQEKIDNFTHQQLKNVNEALLHQSSKESCKQSQQEQFFPVETVLLNIVMPSQSDRKMCSKCNFTIEAKYALTFLYGNNTKQPSYICLDCFMWRQWAVNSSSVAQRSPQHLLQKKHDKNNRKRRKHRLSPIVFIKIQEKAEQLKSLSASKDNQ